MSRVEVSLDLNRVEGDLEIKVALEDGVVAEARTIGNLYRGFEQIMVGRSPRDALVITPRVCGICGTSHLYAAVLALEHIWNLPVPANATRIRNLCLMAEGLQNDLRQTFLFFTPDFCNPRYQDHPMFDELMAAFEPFKGEIYKGTLEQTRRSVQIVAHFGGQWPHSSYMLPGGVVQPPNERRLLACRAVVNGVRNWFEEKIIGATLQDWLAIDSREALFKWLEQPAANTSALGIMTRFARSLNMHRLGAGTAHMISYGSWCDPEAWQPGGDAHLLPSGFYDADTRRIEPLDQSQINEHVKYSWFRPYDGGLHPWQGETIPDFQPCDDRYTWSKAPRYGNKVVQTGPLAELYISGDPLITSLFDNEGDSAWLRQFARVRRTAVELQRARQMIDELSSDMTAPHIINPSPESEVDGEGFGLVMAARGALGHWIKIKDGVIEKYQIVTPTAWNASPRDSSGEPGHWERSLVGVAVQDPDDPLEIGHLIRSHDPCLVCTVHMIGSEKRLRFTP